MVFVVLLSIIGIALLLTVLTKKDLCLCLFATVPSVIGLLYLGAFLGPLRATAVVLLYAGLAAGPAAIALAFREKRARALLVEVLSPGPLLFAVAAVAYWVSYRDATFAFWDEFNNWGVAIKEMFVTDSSPTGGTRIVFQDYPRGTALFQYFFVRNVFWSEGVVYFAQFALSAVPFVALFRGYRWRQAHWVALTLVFVLLLCHMTGFWLRALYVDFALAAYFGAVLILYLTSDAESSTIALLIPSLFMMPLVKKPGLGFALICATVIYADLMLRRLSGRTGLSVPKVIRAAAVRMAAMGATDLRSIAGKKTIVLLALGVGATPLLAAWTGWLGALLWIAAVAVAASVSSRRPWVFLAGWLRRWRPSRRAAVLALVVLAPLAAHGSWQLWVSASGVRISHYFGAHKSYLTALECFTRRATPFELEIRQAFVTALRSKPIGLLCEKTIYTELQKRSSLFGRMPAVKRLTALEYALISLALFAMAFWMLPSAAAKVRLVACVAILFAGFAAYLVCLLADYLMGIQPAQGRTLLEFHRYAWGYLMAVVMLAWALVAAPGKASPQAGHARGAIAFAGLFVFAAYLYVFENPQYFIVPVDSSSAPKPFRTDWRPFRDMLRPRIDFTRRIAGPEDKVYVVYQDGTGVEFQFAGYQFFPLRTNQQDQTEKSSPCPYDPFARGISARAWARLLTRFSYVFIVRSDDRFWKTYESLFDPDRRKTDFLFRVSYEPSGAMILKPIRGSSIPAPGAAAAGGPREYSQRAGGLNIDGPLGMVRVPRCPSPWGCPICGG